MKRKPAENPQLVILGANPLGKEAEEAYERLHWTPPKAVIEAERPKGVDAEALILVGYIHEVRYTTTEDSQRTKISDLWKHTFKEPPMLCTTPDGDVLIVLGGGLKVTPRGIEG